MNQAHKNKLQPLLDRWQFMPSTDHTGSVRPVSVWKRLYSYWMKFALVLGKVSTAVLLSIFYIVVIGPVSVVLKLSGKDLLDRKAENRTSFWYQKSQQPNTLEQGKHQF